MPALFDEQFIKQVAASRIRGARAGAAPGSGAAGPSAARAGFDRNDSRPYVAGDDPRLIDWNALARLDETYIQRFRDASPPELCILLDRSPSMGRWNVKNNFSQKDRSARRIAGGLGIVALASGIAPSLAGAPGAFHSAALWLRAVEELPFAQAAEWTASIQQLKFTYSKRREWIVLSDLYESELLGSFVERACARGGPVTVGAVWSRADRTAPAEDTEILDVETGERRMFTNADRRAFIQKRERFEEAWSERCRKAGARFIILNAEEPFDKLFISILGARAFL